MKSNTRLDSAGFQLTPTRTRCDMVITANGKTEKIASGLLNPFLAHLKTAQDQIAKGGYSILLEPEPGSDRTWFTKGTVERFVRFVSTPEILERVYTIESEILQIEEAIVIQGNNDMGLKTLNLIEDYQAKAVGTSEGSKIMADTYEEKAIVLYKPDTHAPKANGSTTPEGNSKVQLLKVLENRKTVLQKEQGMAFARAVAASFDIDHMPQLLSFAKCFGASRLMDACLRFTDLWNQKHETGQWLEIEAAEAITCRSDFSTVNASGIMLPSMDNKQNESRHELASEDIGKAGIDPSAEEKSHMGHQVPVGQQGYFQGQFPHPMFPPWPVHSPPGALPVFQPYPPQGMPYYQSYPANGPFYHPPYPPMDDSRFNVGHGAGLKRQSMDSRDSSTEEWEMDATKTRSQGDMELEKEGSQSWGPPKKGGRSGKKQSGKVVIRNINYIASKGQNSSGSESQSASDSEAEKEVEDFQANAPDMMHKNSLASKSKGSHAKSLGELESWDNEGTINRKVTDGGHWQAFQNFLLKEADEHDLSADQDMFAIEKNCRSKSRQNTTGDDPLSFFSRDSVEVQDGRITEFHRASGNVTRMLRASNDEVLVARGEYHHGDGRVSGSTNIQVDAQYTDINGRKAVYRRNGYDDIMIVGRENPSQSCFMSSTDPLAINGFEHPTNDMNRSTQDDRTNDLNRSTQDMTDESFIVPFRLMSLDQVGTKDRTAIDMDSELPLKLHKSENSSKRTVNQNNYEPDDLSLMRESGTDKKTIGYDPALDYEIQVRVEDAASLDKTNKEVKADVKQGSKKSGKDLKAKVTPDALDNKKKTAGPIRKAKPSKLSPLDEARVRAEKLRTYKADLQKMKKEKEVEDLKRLEALKQERQKRIAARGSLTAAKSPLSHQTRKQLPTKLSLTSLRGSKFSDSEPGSSSPLERSKIRTASLGSTDSKKKTNTSKSGNGGHLPGNRLTRSVSSLPEPRKEKSDTDSKSSRARIRRLSEPKTMSNPHVATIKAQGAGVVSKAKLSNEPESKRISAIIDLDNSKAATLPELKIRTTKALDAGKNKSAPKEMVQKVNGNKSLVTSGVTELSRDGDKHTNQSGVDDNPVIDKTVVMLECEKPSVSVAHSWGQNLNSQKDCYNNHDKVEKIEIASEYTATFAPALPIETVDVEPIQSQSQEHPRFHEIMTCSVEKEADGAPYARLSSLEDPRTAKLEHGKAPSTCLEAVTTGMETAKVQVSGFKNLKLGKNPESMEKPQVKESPKGIRRLWKLGKKNHSVDLDHASGTGSEVDGNATNVASSSEVHTLKNLVSQDETPTSGYTTQKSSRPFSLLSPFRSKTSEKKLTT